MQASLLLIQHREGRSMYFSGRVGAKNLQIIAAFSFGVIFVSVILFIVFSGGEISNNKMWVIRVVMSLAAAGVAAVLPGFMDIEGRLPWLNLTLVRAGGAMAVFLIVFIYPSINPPPPPPPVYIPKTLSRTFSDKWVELISNKDYENAYLAMSNSVKTKYPKDQFIEVLSPIMTPLGGLKEKNIVSTTSFESPPGMEKGAYSQYIYKAKYDSIQKNIYIEVTLIGEESLHDWRVYSFRFAEKNSAGILIPLEIP